MALLGSQALCLELASQAEHLPWKQLLGATQTRPSELAESPADNEHKSRAGVGLFFAGDIAMPVRCAYNARNSSPADSGFSSLIVPVVSVSTHLCCPLDRDKQLPLAPKQRCSGHGCSFQDNFQEPHEQALSPFPCDVPPAWSHQPFHPPALLNALMPQSRACYTSYGVPALVSYSIIFVILGILCWDKKPPNLQKYWFALRSIGTTHRAKLSCSQVSCYAVKVNLLFVGWP